MKIIIYIYITHAFNIKYNLLRYLIFGKFHDTKYTIHYYYCIYEIPRKHLYYIFLESVFFLNFMITL